MRFAFFFLVYCLLFRGMRGYVRGVEAAGGEAPWWITFNYDTYDFCVIGVTIAVLSSFVILMFKLP